MLRKNQLLSRHVSRSGRDDTDVVGTVGAPHMSEEYARKYQTLEEIGKGAFGFVKLAERRADGVEVVVKFIKKEAVLAECWEQDDGRFNLPKIPNDIAAGVYPAPCPFFSHADTHLSILFYSFISFTHTHTHTLSLSLTHTHSFSF